MARISGVDIPNAKRVEVALTYIYGIGPKSARDILAMKRINNGWDDVAKELGLDASVLREAFRPGWMMGGPGMGPGMGRPGMRGGEEPIPVPPPMPPQERE